MRLRDLWPIGVVLIAFFAYSMVVVLQWWPFTENVDGGKLGDSYGILTSLFNGLAFSGLIVTILLQSRELALQREELAQTRTQLSSQAESLRAQNDISFFLELFRERRELISSWADPQSSARGREGLRVTQARLLNHARALMGEYDRDALGEHCWLWFLDYLHVAQPLIGVHIEMLRVIDRLGTDETTRALANRLSVSYKSTLTAPELGLLFYFGLTVAGRAELAALLDRHAAFRDQVLLAITRAVEFGHLHFYAPRMYGRDAPWAAG